MLKNALKQDYRKPKTFKNKSTNLRKSNKNQECNQEKAQIYDYYHFFTKH